MEYVTEQYFRDKAVITFPVMRELTTTLFLKKSKNLKQKDIKA